MGVKWKTYLGAVVIAVSAGLQAVPELVWLGEMVFNIGVAIGVVGVGHKIQRVIENKSQ